MHALGVPIEAGRLADLGTLAPADTLPRDAFFVAALAAEDGRWSDFDRASAHLRQQAQRLNAAQDSTNARYTQGLIRAIEGYAAWRRGDRTQARTLLEVGQHEASGHGPAAFSNFVLRYWLGMLALEDGRPSDAERYFGANFWTDRPLVADRLGQAYEAGGDREKAREAYELFVMAWENADPALQPRVEAARQGLLRLGFGRRG
jgi:predicted Zn-dependent protease